MSSATAIEHTLSTQKERLVWPIAAQRRGLGPHNSLDASDAFSLKYDWRVAWCLRYWCSVPLLAGTLQPFMVTAQG